MAYIDYWVKSVLPNGMQVLIQPRQYARTVSWAIFVAHGVRDETRETNGISHFLEHVIFNAQYRQQSDLARLIRQGSIVEAFTTKEYTQFSVTTVPEESEAALRGLAHLVLHPIFDQAIIDAERAIVETEIATFLSTRKALDEWLEKALFGDRSLGLFTLGPRDNLIRFDSERLASRYMRFYVPIRTILVCQGPVNGPAMLEKVADDFNGWRQVSHSIEPARFEDSPQLIGIPAPTARVSLLIGFRGPGLLSPDRLAFALLADGLGLGIGSRLWNVLREQRQLVYDIQAVPMSYGPAGYVNIRLSCEREHVRDVIHLVLDEVARLHQGLEPAELERCRMMRATGLLQQYENARQLLPAIGRFAVNGLTLFVDAEIQHLNLISPDDTARVAQQYLTEDTLAMVAYGMGREELLRLVA